MQDASITFLCTAVERELFKNVIPFWCKYSPDHDNGGFYTCLDENGEVYDTRKFMWLNGRQIWMFARVCLDISDSEADQVGLNKANMLELACKAADFALNNAVREDGLAYFSLSADGLPYHFERKIFSLCFLCMGFTALSAHKSLPKAGLYAETATKMLNLIISLAHDPTPLGRLHCPGSPPVSPMNVPMILLNVIDEARIAGIVPSDSMFTTGKLIDYAAEERWCIEELLKHVITSKSIVLEVVGVDGSIIPGYDGRHMNPGHAIEAGWFILAYAKRNNRSDLKEIARSMIDWSFEAGWDKEHGGLFYFLDSEGRSPPYLEWSMKLWWPHTETLVAYAMLYEETKEQKYWDRLVLVYDYTITHFSDASGHGEWFGYLDQAGKRTHRFKGGPYKGCFHVPRSLFFVRNILKQIISSNANTEHGCNK